MAAATSKHIFLKMNVFTHFSKQIYQILGKNSIKNVTIQDIKHIRNRASTSAVHDANSTEITQQKPTDDSVFAPADPEELVDLARNLKPTYTFASYANNSPTIQELVKLGVDLSKMERKKDLVELVLKMNFEKDVQPYIRFLHDNGVHADDLGKILTKNIAICRESVDNLQTRINYLESKNFDKEMISAIITKNPLWLTTPVSVIDGRLGWLQQNFKLTGNDVRFIINSLPQIATFSLNTIKLNMFVLEEELGITKADLRRLIKKRPKIFITNQHKLLAAHEYVHKVMRVPMELINHQPDILMERKHRIRERHLFLESLGRAQYNPQLPGYVSLDSFIKSSDLEFCTEIAKSSLMSYDAFLKTL